MTVTIVKEDQDSDGNVQTDTIVNQKIKVQMATFRYESDQKVMMKEI